MHLTPIPPAQLYRTVGKRTRAQELTDQMNDISILRARDTNEKIVGLDVAIYEGLVMDRLNSRNLMQGRETKNNGPVVRGSDSPFALQPCTLF